MFSLNWGLTGLLLFTLVTERESGYKFQCLFINAQFDSILLAHNQSKSTSFRISVFDASKLLL